MAPDPRRRFSSFMKCSGPQADIKISFVPVTLLQPDLKSVRFKHVCQLSEWKCLPIVVYLPHARTVEPQKPRNTHAMIELQIESKRC
jgi:hypothetical protein